MLEEIKKILTEYIDDTSKITNESRFVSDIGLSSLDLLAFFGNVEEKFSIPRINESDIPKILTVGDLIIYIQNNK